MVKLSLEQIDSLIEDNKMSKDQLKEHMKEGYNSEDIMTYFESKINEFSNVESEGLEEDDDEWRD